MSRRGEIVVECDVKDCHAEEVLTPSDLVATGVEFVLLRRGWASIVRQTDATWVCPDCVEEGKTP